MKTQSKKRLMKWAAAGVMASAAVGMDAHAQSADALLDKLVEKGVLTSKEANELREESDKGFTTAYQVKSGMPDWVTALKINGDFRARMEDFLSDDTYTNPATGRQEQWVDRMRFRYRLRLGLVAQIKDNFEVGVRLTSSEPAGNFGGDPISGNATMTGDGSKKFVYFDLAYGRWYALNGPQVTGNVTLGKMENPIVVSDMVFDGDYTPEGIGSQWSFAASDTQSIKVNMGGFVLSEIGSSANDVYMGAIQAILDSTWSKKLSTSVGVTGLGIMNSDKLRNDTVPNINRGNTRLASTAPAYAFNPIVAGASVTWTLDSFPLYAGAFPIKVGGEYMVNPAAPSSGNDINGRAVDNNAYNVGVIFGKSGKKGTWDLQFSYKYLGANAWYEEVVDSDFGAFYGTLNAPANSGFGIGYGSGTNVKGYVAKFTYSPTDFLALSVKWFGTKLINAYPVGGDSEMNRIQLDASIKF
jgi:hypothetical protein